MKDKTTMMKSKADKQLVNMIAKRIARLPKGEWEVTPREQKKSYVQAARRALAVVRTAEERRTVRLERRAKRVEAAKQAG